MWMSLAPSFAACVSSALSMRMIGASLRGLEQVLDRRQLLHHARQVDRALDLADHRRGARLAAGVGGGDAAGQRRGGLALEARRRRTGAAPRDSAGRATVSRRPQHQALRRRPRAAACAPWRRRRAAGGGRPWLQPPGAEAGAGGAGCGSARGGGEAGGVPARVPASSAARRSARRCPRAAQRRQHRRLVDRHQQARPRLLRPAGTRGSGRSGRARACSRSRRRASPIGRRKTIRLVRFAVAGLAAEQRAEIRDVAEQRHLRLVVGVAGPRSGRRAPGSAPSSTTTFDSIERLLVVGPAFDGAGRGVRVDGSTPPGRSSSGPCRSRRSAA